MNKMDKLELEKNIKDLQVRNNELKARNNELKELILAENNLENAEKFDKEFKENLIKITESENDITEAKNKLVNEPKGEQKMSKYIESKNSVVDFIATLANSRTKEEVKNKWRAKLVENGVTIKDDSLMTPNRLVSAIETSLTDSNPVFKVFNLTHVGALLVSQGLTSDDEAQVHIEGTEKTVQSAVLTIDSITPQMIYKIQTISERAKNLQANYDEIYSVIVAELTQKIVNKAVDLALIEGDGKNGFMSIANEKDTKKVASISGAKYVDAIEDACDFVRGTTGTKYLVLTAAQRKLVLAELRALNTNVRIKNNDADIADEVGVDELIIYTGTKAIKPTLIVDKTYHIDMKDLTKVDAFEWKTNENAILIESLSAGKVEKLKAAAVITVTP
ncbi:phage major capsid protein [Lactococcus hircilactis]|uniref:Phage major capsid protein n=1 Tax=Lactococcus hircilactis TaxID=1494462 RepID=A0A7X1ZA48_9LACT|nr:phage major capsid protein [Lactococcus hircilactis]MQW40648.1 phage major capsid protein [Lactococcus hircilactis]